MHPEVENWLFIGFTLLIAVFLALDLGLFNRSPKAISTRKALWQSIGWVTVAVGFGVLIWYMDDHKQALDYYSAYVTEYALSVDNIFVIVLILRYFKVDPRYYHKVLFWGILGAVIMRGIFILLGAVLIHEFHWILYIFGAFLLYTGFKMLLSKHDADGINEDANPILKFARARFRITSDYYRDKFYIRKEGKLFFTPLFLVIILIESTDLLFAVDSIPAVFIISQDPFIVYTSNIFAVMGLRAMFFLLSGVIDKFYLLQKGLSVVLIFIGVKMLLEPCVVLLNRIMGTDFPHVISSGYSFAFIIIVLAGSVILSILRPQNKLHHPTEVAPVPQKPAPVVSPTSSTT